MQHDTTARSQSPLRIFPLAILALTGLAAQAAPAPAAGATPPVVFNRDIRPVMSDNCLSCHGPDPASRKAGLRLDTREGLFSATDKRGPTVIPGQPDKSPLWQRIITTDVDDVMPPPKTHKMLTADQKALFRRWIEQGATWQPHWAFLKPERPPVPQAGALQTRVRNPIDAFLFDRLAAMGLSPAPEADRRTLARRLSLDLIGLPPQPAEVEAFVKDKSPDYYSRYVERLLASPHWGEHRGRYWLDAARYADTHGLHFDNYREMWPYRDWVIQAFNRNLPFDRFTLEQLAGDLLPNPTVDQQVATGFHRCNPTTNEGGTIEEENLVGYARDRVETTSWVWLGLTANCAVCHDHKYDPITTRDFYSMSAFFRNTTQTGFDGNVKESNPNLILVDTDAERARLNALPGEIEAARKSLEKPRKDGEASFEKWLATAEAKAIEDSVGTTGLLARIPLNDGTNSRVSVVTPKGTRWIRSEGALTVKDKGQGKTGAPVQFGPGVTVRFPGLGDFERDQPFSFAAWVQVPGDFEGKAPVISRMEGTGRSRGWDLTYEHRHYSVHLVHEWPDDAIRLRTRFQSARKGGWQHVAVTYDGSGRPEGVRLFLDGRPAEVEADRVRSLKGTLRTRAPLTLAQHDGGNHLDGLMVQDLRLFKRQLPAWELNTLVEMATLRDWLGKKPADRKPEPKAVLQEYFLMTQDAAYRTARGTLAALEREKEGLRLNHPVTHVQKEKADSMGMAHILARGEYDKRKDKVEPAVFAALNPLPKDAPKNRLGLARWLTDRENPLTARVTVNRFWQELFGTGLVKTSEDLGIMGEPPSHPELLDWLATEFQDSGWDVKHLFRLMVESEAYRQSADVTPEKAEKDPANRNLSRGPRFRMDAEMVRDYALAAGGLLNARIGGVSVRPYQPQGVWEPVAMPESNTKYYHEDKGADLYRRSLYTVWKRAAPPANMDVFNAPSRETSCLRRERTNTPLQALATMNDPQFVEAARHLAATALKAGSRQADRVMDRMALRVLSRPLRDDEKALVKAGLDQALAYYQAHPADAREFLRTGATPAEAGVPEAVLAAWTLTANQLLNLDETLNK